MPKKVFLPLYRATANRYTMGKYPKNTRRGGGVGVSVVSVVSRSGEQVLV